MTDEDARRLLVLLRDYVGEYDEDPTKLTVSELAGDLVGATPRGDEPEGSAVLRPVGYEELVS